MIKTKKPIIANMGDEKKTLLLSFFITLLFFFPFVSQSLFSDVVTFAKGGDQLNICYPTFARQGQLLYNGILSGNDLLTLNGASEFYMRAGTPIFYLPFMIAAYFGTAIGAPYAAYIIINAIHMFAALYYSQRLAQKHFLIEYRFSVLYMVSCLAIISLTTWFSSFMVIASLVFPTLYYSLSLVKNYDKKRILLYTLPIVLCFTSGYIIYSFALVGFVYIITMIYAYYVKKNTIDKKTIINITSPYIVAGIICFVYSLSILIYVKHIVNSDAMTLYFATALSITPNDLPIIVLNSYKIAGIEEEQLINIGLVWSAFILLTVCGIIKTSINKAEKGFIRATVIINIIILLCMMGTYTPFGVWLYSFIPIIGQNHLPGRFLIFTMPTLFLSFCIIASRLTENKEAKRKQEHVIEGIIACIMATVAVSFCIISSQITITWINVYPLIIECLLSAVVMAYVAKYGWKSKYTICAWSAVLIIFSVTWFNQYNSISIQKNELASSTINENESDEQQLQNYIGSIPDKLIYRYVCLDSSNVISPYIRQNYPWIQKGEHQLVNYLGYDLHGAIPKDYGSLFYWFDAIDWNYITDTRGDIVVLDTQYAEQMVNSLSNVIDNSIAPMLLSNGMIVYHLKRFVPSFFTGGDQYIEDIPGECFDNGYFYSPNLKEAQVRRFETDTATYFSVTTNNEMETQMTFLPYNSKYYHYYLDGEEFVPNLTHMQAYWNIPSGEHNCEIVFKNPLALAGVYIVLGYYIVIALTLIIMGIKRLRKRGKKHDTF